MIYVIGDSHSRSFARNSDYKAIFIGPGKENCFVSKKHAWATLFNARIALRRLPEKSTVMFVLGEPDTRFYLGKGWTPWDSDSEDVVELVDQKIELSVSRYLKFLMLLKREYSHRFLVYSVSPSERENQNIYVREMNAQLRNGLENIEVFMVDIENALLKDDMRVKIEYMLDAVHLTTDVQPLVKNVFDLNGYRYKAEIEPKVLDDSNIVYSENFGCYVLVLSPIQKLFKKLGKLFRQF